MAQKLKLRCNAVNVHATVLNVFCQLQYGAATYGNQAEQNSTAE